MVRVYRRPISPCVEDELKIEMAIWERGAVECLIHLYSEKACLFAVTSPDYHNKIRRSSALQEISESLNDIRPGTTTEEVKLKINGLRTQFMAERSKLRKSAKSGAGRDDVVKTNWWCYSLLGFLEAYSKPRKSISNLEESSANCESASLDEEFAPPPNVVEDTGSCASAGSTTSSSLKTPPTKKRKVDSVLEMNKFLEGATAVLEDSRRRPSPMEHIGMYVGSELGKINNEIVRKRTILKIHQILLDAFIEDQEC